MPSWAAWAPVSRVIRVKALLPVSGQVGGADGEGVEEPGGDRLGAGFDGVPASRLDEFLEQSDDAVGAAEQVLGHPAAAEHAVAAVQEAELLLDADEVGGPGGGAVRGGVAEPVEVDELEPQVGLPGGGVVAALTAVLDRRE